MQPFVLPAIENARMNVVWAPSHKVGWFFEQSKLVFDAILYSGMNWEHDENYVLQDINYEEQVHQDFFTTECEDKKKLDNFFILI